MQKKKKTVVSLCNPAVQYRENNTFYRYPPVWKKNIPADTVVHNSVIPRQNPILGTTAVPVTVLPVWVGNALCRMKRTKNNMYCCTNKYGLRCCTVRDIAARCVANKKTCTAAQTCTVEMLYVTSLGALAGCVANKKHALLYKQVQQRCCTRHFGEFFSYIVLYPNIGVIFGVFTEYTRKKSAG